MKGGPRPWKFDYFFFVSNEFWNVDCYFSEKCMPLHKKFSDNIASRHFSKHKTMVSFKSRKKTLIWKDNKLIVRQRSDDDRTLIDFFFYFPFRKVLHLRQVRDISKYVIVVTCANLSLSLSSKKVILRSACRIYPELAVFFRHLWRQLARNSFLWLSSVT